MENLATRIARLSPEKRALLDVTLKQRDLTLPAHQVIPRRTNHGPAPLSFAQQRLWFLTNLDPSSAAYNQPKAIRLTGELNIDALNKALNALIKRHEILRTTVLPSESAPPTQIVGEPRPLNLQVIDLSEISNTDKPTELENRFVEITGRHFDLARDLMLRAVLLKLDEADHLLVLVTHHIATDGWSVGILWRELAAFYRAFLEGDANPLPDMAIQYADFAVWQRNRLQGEVLRKHIDYWKNQLNGISTLQLPLDRPRPAVQSYRGATQSLLLPKLLASQLHALSRQQGVTLFMTLLAAFQALLYRYSGQADIALGSPIAGRTRAETEGLIGFFVNTLVIRTDLSGDPTFLELLARVRKIALAAYEHQELPFEKLVEELHPHRDLSRSPLFQVTFAHQNQPWQPLEFPGLAMSPVQIKNHTAKFDLSLDTWEEPDGLKVILEYNTDLFDDATMTRMIAHYHTLLEAIVTNPNQRLALLPLLTEKEKHQLLIEWNDTNSDFPQDKCIHELFEEQVEKSPNAVALRFDNQTLTYRDLNTKANQLGHYLRALGVGPGILVGLCIQRSIEMVVGMLGILKAGGAYVPIDPDYPLNRLRFMVESINAPVLITQNDFVNSLDLPKTQVFSLDRDWPETAHHAETNPTPLSGSNDLLYVIYTSGSTGRPKGAGVYQRGFANLLHWFTTTFSISANDRVLLLSSPSFDLTQKNIFGTLLVGGELHLLPGGQHDPDQITRIVSEQRITLVNCTPSAFYPLIERHRADTFEMLSSLRMVFLGGEPISIPRLRSWLESDACNCEIINTYGPTECTDICAYYRMNRQNIDDYPFVPIGRPIFNVQLVVLDEQLRLCPVGVAGELCVAGVGVGSGYINDPGLTAEKFIPSPIPEFSGDKIYKTGDRVRTLADGNIEYLERLDHQVKLRGFRIELGEIEAALGQHPTVHEAVVVTRDSEPGEKRLVAYVVSSTEMAATASELRAFLRERLPDYMIPAAIVTLKALPLTVNGKVDRTALPTPDQTNGNVERNYVAPRDTLEHQLTKIWEKLLEVKSIGIRDNFFQLGGHSLLAITMIAEIEKQLAKHLPLAALFQAPTVEELASVLRQKDRSESWSSLLAIQPKGPKLPFFCVQGSTALAHHLGPDQPFYALRPAPLEGKKSFCKVEDIAADFIKEIQALQPEGPYLLGGFSFGSKVAFEMAHQLRKQGHEVRLLALLDPGIIHNGKRSAAVSSISSTFSGSTTLFSAELHRRLSKVKVLKPQQQLSFLWNGVRWRVEAKIANIRKEIMKIACWFYLATGLRLPPGLRSFYFGEVSRRAELQYRPYVYPGRLIVFPTEELANETRLEWRRLAGGGIDVHVVPGNHHTIMKESGVRIWAEQLKAYLDEAQAAR